MSRPRRFIRQIVEKIPNSYFVLSNLGAVQIEGGKLSAAEVALKKAVEINGNDSYAYTNLGIAYSRQGKFDEAIDALHKAITFNDEDAVAHNYLGACLGQSEQWNEAEVQLKRAIELKTGISGCPLQSGGSLRNDAPAFPPARQGALRQSHGARSRSRRRPRTSNPIVPPRWKTRKRPTR